MLVGTGEIAPVTAVASRFRFRYGPAAGWISILAPASITGTNRRRSTGGAVSTQELDVKKSWRAIRRHRRVVAAVAAVGLLGGIAVALWGPPLYTARSLVVLPTPPASEAQKAVGTQSIDAQVVIAAEE